MAGELQQTIERLRAKMLVVSDRFALVVNQRDQALAKIAELEGELAKERKQTEQLKQENDFLRIATTIAPERKDVAQTRALLAELVREIDKCIADLKE
jgi:chromosome segregation ATPase